MTKYKLLTFSRAVWIPIPTLKGDIEKLLENDYPFGSMLVNQFTSYTAQFITMSEALYSFLNRLSPNELLLHVNILLNSGINEWDLLKEGTGKLVWGFGITILNFLRLKIVRNDRASLLFWKSTAASIACSGYWSLHMKRLKIAREFFEDIRQLVGGEEAYCIATLIASQC